jgi:signal transduction histidine kinase
MIVLTLPLLLSGWTASASENLTNILLLNSYHDGYDWSNDTKKGIKDVFDLELSDYYMRIEHMDTKNISSDAYMEELVNLYKFKFDPDEFDIIMCADDNALKFLLKYRDEIFSDTPVFFSGVNTLTTHDFTKAEGFYGVVEKHSIAQTTEIILKLNPNLKHVYLFVDDSITGKASKKDAVEDMAYLKDQVELHFFDDLSFDKIMKTVATLDPKDTVVIQAYYVVDQDGSTYPLNYTAERLIEASSVPVFGIFSFGFGQGSVGGKFVEGYTQGHRAASMVVEYLNTKAIKGSRYIVDESFNRYHFDYNAMVKYGYDLTLLPKTSILINAPVSFYEKHKKVINVSIVAMVLLMVYVFILRRQVRIQTNRMVTTQTQLLESEKMASLGRMVAGVAHEVNTPIGIGVSLASFLRLETDKTIDKLAQNDLSGQDLKKYIVKVAESSESMLSTMERAADLIRNFKQVAVDQMVDEKRPVNLEHYIQDIITSLKSELKHKAVSIDVICNEKIITNCHTGAIYQILLNLIMNSLKHGFDTSHHGKITIELSLIRNDIELRYHDDGEGIQEKDLKYIFDPFYTTKRHKGGSGLGLNIVHNLVTHRLGGTIKCNSEHNNYTEFIIVFPMN